MAGVRKVLPQPLLGSDVMEDAFVKKASEVSRSSSNSLKFSTQSPVQNLAQKMQSLQKRFSTLSDYISRTQENQRALATKLPAFLIAGDKPPTGVFACITRLIRSFQLFLCRKEMASYHRIREAIPDFLALRNEIEEDLRITRQELARQRQIEQIKEQERQARLLAACSTQENEEEVSNSSENSPRKTCCDVVTSTLASGFDWGMNYLGSFFSSKN